MHPNGGLETIEVVTSSASYDVHIGEGLLARLDELVSLPKHASRIAIVSSGFPRARYAEQVADSFRRLGLAVSVLEISDGESAKTLDTVAMCYRAFSEMALGRDDVVVAVGGGVVGDLVGFAAATWNRGVAVIQVPTTVLSQVDSSIGGKTGVDLPTGKNLVGAFHQPLSVIADSAPLTTLPIEELRSGLSEIVKYGFIADPAILDIVEANPTAALDPHSAELAELIARSIKVKVDVVAADEHESGRRAILNYGHTVGHAIEALGSYSTYRHGEAVAVGMVFASRLSERLGLSEIGLADRTIDILTSLGLPTGSVTFNSEQVWDFMQRDKKVRHGVRFVICPQPGFAELIDQPEVSIVDEVLATLAKS